MPSEFEAIVFDLDDTILDTFHLLISPLEKKAVKIMKENNPLLPSEKIIHEEILKLRKNDPSNISVQLTKKFEVITESDLALRSKVFSDFDISKISIPNSIKSMLKTLGKKYDFYLLTQGNRKTQEGKIKKLNIDKYFKEVIIISDDKQAALKQLYLQKNTLLQG